MEGLRWDGSWTEIAHGADRKASAGHTFSREKAGVMTFLRSVGGGQCNTACTVVYSITGNRDSDMKI